MLPEPINKIGRSTYLSDGYDFFIVTAVYMEGGNGLPLGSHVIS